MPKIVGSNDSSVAKQKVVDEHWMRQALLLAQHAADLNEVPVGAVVVCDGDMIGEGWNQPIASGDPTAHAEIVALRYAAKRLNNYRLVNSTLYVTLEPCTMCAGALVHARIDRVVYGATEPKSGVIQSNGCVLEQAYFNYKVAYVGGVLAEQSSQLISRFFRQRREEKKLNLAHKKTEE